MLKGIHKNTAIFITKKCGDVFENELYSVCLKMFTNDYVNLPLKAKIFQRFLKADHFFFQNKLPLLNYKCRLTVKIIKTRLYFMILFYK